jgi:hypothetical protein
MHLRMTRRLMCPFLSEEPMATDRQLRFQSRQVRELADCIEVFIVEPFAVILEALPPDL